MLANAPPIEPLPISKMTTKRWPILGLRENENMSILYNTCRHTNSTWLKRNIAFIARCIVIFDWDKGNVLIGTAVLLFNDNTLQCPPDDEAVAIGFGHDLAHGDNDAGMVTVCGALRWRELDRRRLGLLAFRFDLQFRRRK